MGTTCDIQVYDSDPARAERAVTRALDEMQRVDGVLSNYNPATELSAMNREAPRSPYHASAELFDFVEACRRYHDETSGAFDPTVGPIVRAWGFFTTRPAKPSDDVIAAAKAKSGFDKITLNERDRTISYAVSGLELDPGGIGKGYAVDRAVLILKQAGIRSALVSAGGSSIYALGRPPGRSGWRIAIKDPADWQRAVATVDLRDNSLSTSGVAEQSVQSGTHRYSHIFDPRTGDSVDNMCQVTVVAATGTDTDALTKGAYILTRETVTEIAARRPGMHVLRMEGACGPGSAIWITPRSGSVFRQTQLKSTPALQQ
jgi:thiamine biosynthesis lipoprotein